MSNVGIKNYPYDFAPNLRFVCLKCGQRNRTLEFKAQVYSKTRYQTRPSRVAVTSGLCNELSPVPDTARSAIPCKTACMGWSELNHAGSHSLCRIQRKAVGI